MKAKKAKKTIIVVLAMHGAPPRDFPRKEMREYFELQARAHEPSPEAGRSPRLKELEAKMRAFPRNKTNDPFWQGSLELAAALEKACALPVLLGFNEFCAPSLDETFDRAAAQGAKKIIVVTPMMTRGGEHAEADIPAAISRALKRHPGLAVFYAWPLEIEEIAVFLAKTIKKFSGK